MLDGDLLTASYRLETHQAHPVPSYNIWVDASTVKNYRAKTDRPTTITVEIAALDACFPDPCTRANQAYGVALPTKMTNTPLY